MSKMGFATNSDKKFLQVVDDRFNEKFGEGNWTKIKVIENGEECWCYESTE